MSKLEEFIEERDDEGGNHSPEYYGLLDDLRELGKTHVVLPREPSDNMLAAAVRQRYKAFAMQAKGEDVYSSDMAEAMYKAMIQASE